MATALTQRLTQAHDAQQRLLAQQLANLLRSRWGATMTGPGQGDQQFLDEALRAIRAQHQTSARLARGFYTQARRLEFPGEPRVAVELPEFVEEAVVTSIVAAGFDELSQALKRGDTLEEALTRAGTSVTGAGVRQGLRGGRQAIINATLNDRIDVAYARVPRPDCCSFCAVLASRGAVYQRDSFDQSDPRFIGPGEIKVHDTCRCEFRPIWHREEQLPDINREFADLWAAVKEANRNLTGNDALNAFRREYRRIQKVRSVAAASQDAA